MSWDSKVDKATVGWTITVQCIQLLQAERSQFSVYSYCRLNNHSWMCTVTAGWTITVECVQLLQAERSQLNVYNYCRLNDHSWMYTVTAGWTITVECTQLLQAERSQLNVYSYCRFKDQSLYPNGDRFRSPHFLGQFWGPPNLLPNVTLSLARLEC